MVRGSFNELPVIPSEIKCTGRMRMFNPDNEAGGEFEPRELAMADYLERNGITDLAVYDE